MGPAVPVVFGGCFVCLGVPFRQIHTFNDGLQVEPARSGTITDLVGVGGEVQPCGLNTGNTSRHSGINPLLFLIRHVHDIGIKSGLVASAAILAFAQTVLAEL